MATADLFLDHVVAVARTAGAVAHGAFRMGVDVDDKAAFGGACGSPFDPVTRADREAEAAARRAIATRFPDHGVIGEEYGEDRPEAEFVWVLDPIDGTRAFISGLPLWTTLVGLLREGRPWLGAIHQPCLDELFLGGPEGTVLLKEGAPSRPVRTRACASLGEATLSTTDPFLFQAEEAEGFARLRRACRLARYGCDAYAYAMVADGHMDLVAESGLKPWDWQPIAPVVRGAGGRINGWDGRAPGADGRILCAGDPRLLAPVLSALAGDG